jgi:hypothetical protein
MKSVLIFLSSICVLSACSQHSDTFNPNNYPLYQVPTDGQDTSKQLLDQANVTCADANCPSSVALLALGTNSMAGSCTSFLISPTLALTNSHCVPNEVRTKTQAPADTMKLLFPITTANPTMETVTVSEVIFYSTINPESSDSATSDLPQPVIGKLPDYALLRLSQPITDRPFLTLSHQGVPDGIALTAYSVDPISQTAITGVLRTKTCQSLMNSAIQPSYTNAFTSIISFTGCEIIHGNSGSPLVDANGQVRAILHAAIDKNGENLIGAKYGLTSTDYLNLATNISCLSLPGVQTPADAHCADAIPQLEFLDGINQITDDNLKDPAMMTKVQDALDAKSADWVKSINFTNPFQWKVTGSSTKDQYFPLPSCYADKNIESAYTMIIPRWTLYGKFDSTFRFDGIQILETKGDDELLQLVLSPANERYPITIQYNFGADDGILGSVPDCNAR